MISLFQLQKESYKEIGVELNPELMDFNTMLSKVGKGDYDLAKQFQHQELVIQVKL